MWGNVKKESRHTHRYIHHILSLPLALDFLEKKLTSDKEQETKMLNKKSIHIYHVI